MSITTDTDAYAIKVFDDSMSPAFKPGDIVTVNTAMQPPADGWAHAAVFRNHSEDGETYVMLRGLVGHDDENWHVYEHEHNPESRSYRKVFFDLPRLEWQECHCVVSTEFGRAVAA